MNRIFHLVWNHALCVVQVVSELARSALSGGRHLPATHQILWQRRLVVACLLGLGLSGGGREAMAQSVASCPTAGPMYNNTPDASNGQLAGYILQTASSGTAPVVGQQAAASGSVTLLNCTSQQNGLQLIYTANNAGVSDANGYLTAGLSLGIYNVAGSVTTSANKGYALDVESLGGAGGSGTPGGLGGGVYALNWQGATLATSGDNASGIRALSEGGNGGSGANGGYAGWLAEAVNGGAITTTGNNAGGIYVHSVGGNGGNGGVMVSQEIVNVGADGGNGGYGVEADASNTGSIQTSGISSPGIDAKSVGGGGGNGGEAEGGFLFASVSVGGSGGGGGNGGLVDVVNQGGIATSGASSEGIIARSIGGGGGNGGNATAVSAGLFFSSAVAIGGSGGNGGSGGAVNVLNAGSISTMSGFDASNGDWTTSSYAQSMAAQQAAASPEQAMDVGYTLMPDSAHGILAQSVGGGGGQGGSAMAISAAVGTIGAMSVSFSMGGHGGSGGSGGNVDVDNTGGNIKTDGTYALGIVAQSIGGGGGSGGDTMSVAASLSNPVESISGAVALALGGSGGSGGDAGLVVVNPGLAVQTSGDGSIGVLAQSIGGGGGNGGNVVNAAATLGQNALTIGFALGGTGGAGGKGNMALVSNENGSFPGGVSYDDGRGDQLGNLYPWSDGSGTWTAGEVETAGAKADGIVAQSIGGGGGNGGSVNSYAISVQAGKGMAGNFSAIVGGKGGNGNVGGTAMVQYAGDVHTIGDESNGILVQSIGGGGGNGGNVSALNITASVPINAAQAQSGSPGTLQNVTISAAVGGNGGRGNDGGSASAELAPKATVETEGERADGILVQSIGGGGGNGGNAQSFTAATSAPSLSSLKQAAWGELAAYLSLAVKQGEAAAISQIPNATAQKWVSQLGLSAKIKSDDGANLAQFNAQAQNEYNAASDILGKAQVATYAVATAQSAAGQTSADITEGDAIIAHLNAAAAELQKGAAGAAAAKAEYDEAVADVTIDRAAAEAALATANTNITQANAAIASNTALIAKAQSDNTNYQSQLAQAGEALASANASISDQTAIVSHLNASLQAIATGVTTLSEYNQANKTSYGSNQDLANAVVAAKQSLAQAQASAKSAQSSIDSTSAAIAVNNTKIIDAGNTNAGFEQQVRSAQSIAATAKANSTQAESFIQTATALSEQQQAVLEGKTANLSVVNQDLATAQAAREQLAQQLATQQHDLEDAQSDAYYSADGSLVSTAEQAKQLAEDALTAADTTANTLGVLTNFKEADNKLASAVDLNSQMMDSIDAKVPGTLPSDGSGSSGDDNNSDPSEGSGGKFQWPTSLTISATVGGSGGAAGNGKDAMVTLDAGSTITTTGGQSHGVVVQSIGGGGGTGGNAASDGLTGVGNMSIGIAIGGYGSGGGDGGTVTVNGGAGSSITTAGDASYAILAQSVGGGGGEGGSDSVSFTANIIAAYISQYYGVSSATASNVAKYAMANLPAFPEQAAIGIGGHGGQAGNGGTVQVKVDTAITTFGANANGIVAQSVGGGGGSGNLSAAQAMLEFNLGGSAGAGGNGGNVVVSDAAAITTAGASAIGILAQSIGGGGGNGGVAKMSEPVGLAEVDVDVGPEGVKPQFPWDVKLALGGEGGSAGKGGSVLVGCDPSSTDCAGTITTTGQLSHAIEAQSIGGGGGANQMSSISPVRGSISFDTWKGISFGSSGQVTVADNANSTFDISTSGDGAVGIVAQSITNGGGTLSLDTYDPNATGATGTLSYSIVYHQGDDDADGGKGGADALVNAGCLSADGCQATDSTNGGTLVSLNGSISTKGRAAFGVLAQSLSNAQTTFLSDGGMDVQGGGDIGTNGAGGQNAVTVNGTIATTGDGAHGIVAMTATSQDQGSGNNITIDGSISTTGADADGVYAQNLSAAHTSLGASDWLATMDPGATDVYPGASLQVSAEPFLMGPNQIVVGSKGSIRVDGSQSVGILSLTSGSQFTQIQGGGAVTASGNGGWGLWLVNGEPNEGVLLPADTATQLQKQQLSLTVDAGATVSFEGINTAAYTLTANGVAWGGGAVRAANYLGMVNLDVAGTIEAPQGLAVNVQASTPSQVAPGTLTGDTANALTVESTGRITGGIVLNGSANNVSIAHGGSVNGYLMMDDGAAVHVNVAGSITGSAGAIWWADNPNPGSAGYAAWQGSDNPIYTHAGAVVDVVSSAFAGQEVDVKVSGSIAYGQDLGPADPAFFPNGQYPNPAVSIKALNASAGVSISGSVTGDIFTNTPNGSSTVELTSGGYLAGGVNTVAESSAIYIDSGARFDNGYIFAQNTQATDINLSGPMMGNPYANLLTTNSIGAGGNVIQVFNSASSGDYATNITINANVSETAKLGMLDVESPNAPAKITIGTAGSLTRPDDNASFIGDLIHSVHSSGLTIVNNGTLYGDINGPGIYLRGMDASGKLLNRIDNNGTITGSVDGITLYTNAGTHVVNLAMADGGGAYINVYQFVNQGGVLRVSNVSGSLLGQGSLYVMSQPAYRILPGSDGKYGYWQQIDLALPNALVVQTQQPMDLTSVTSSLQYDKTSAGLAINGLDTTGSTTTQLYVSPQMNYNVAGLDGNLVAAAKLANAMLTANSLNTLSNQASSLLTAAIKSDPDNAEASSGPTKQESESNTFQSELAGLGKLLMKMSAEASLSGLQTDLQAFDAGGYSDVQSAADAANSAAKNMESCGGVSGASIDPVEQGECYWVKATSDVAGYRNDADRDSSQGLSTGVQREVGDEHFLGLSLNYGRTHYSGDSASSTGDRLMLGGILKVVDGQLFGSVSILGGYAWADGTRRVQVPFADEVLTASSGHEAWLFMPRLHGGYRFAFDWLDVIPMLDVNLPVIHDMGYRETGAGLFDFKVHSNTNVMPDIHPSIQLSEHMMLGEASVRGYLELGERFRFSDVDSYVSMPDALGDGTQELLEQHVDRRMTTYGAGITVDWTDKLESRFTFEQDEGRTSHTRDITAKFAWKF